MFIYRHNGLEMRDIPAPFLHEGREKQKNLNR